jgi:hypothetical protein
VTDRLRTGAVLCAKDMHRLARFFSRVAALDICETQADYVALGCPGFQLIVLRAPKEPELVRLLLDAGSRTEVRFDGETPLIYAARLGREKAVLELVAAGADITARDSGGRAAADHARKKRLSEAVLAALGDQTMAATTPHRARRKRRTG